VRAAFGFERIQDSVYVTRSEGLANLVQAIMALPWFPHYVRDIPAALPVSRAKRAPGERRADPRAILAEVRELHAAERARADRLEAASAEVQRPLLLRLVDGLRRKG
jgi:hypothetical protein